MAGRWKRLVLAALTNTYTTNIYNPSSASFYDVIRHIHIANKSGSAAKFRLFLGATGANAAGTELYYDVSIPAGGYFDAYPYTEMTSTDFLVGGSDTATALTIEIEGERFAT